MTAPISSLKTYCDISRGDLVDPSVIDFRYYRTGRTQKRPYNLNLDAMMLYGKITSYTRNTPEYRIHVPSVSGLPDDDVLAELTRARNKAYERFVAETRNQGGSQLGTNLAERKQAATMMQNRLVQLARFGRSLRKLDFIGAGRHLGLVPEKVPRGLKRNAKSLGNNWLEFHFGWSPLVQDIGATCQVLQDGIPPSQVKTSARDSGSHDHHNVETSYGWPWYEKRYSGLGTARVQYYADVIVDNPNLWLANQLGLINPVSLAWELVPFSFLVDWVGNVGSYLNSYSDFVGLSVTNACRTEFVTRSDFCIEAYPGIGWSHSYSSVRKRMTRSPGEIPGPTLQFDIPSRLSLTRGLTAVSLLLQAMR